MLGNQIQKGRKQSLAERKRRSRAMTGVLAQEKNPNWKGQKAGYMAIHNWLRRYLGSPKRCENCGTTQAKRYDWANISGKYKRDFNDYVRLCVSCHLKMDSKNRVRGQKLAWRRRRKGGVSLASRN